MSVRRFQREQFMSDGYCVLEQAISKADLTTLDAVCERHLARQRADMDLVKADVLGLSHRDRRYFLSSRHTDNPGMEEFLFGERMAGVVRELLGDDAFLFLELFVVKPRLTGMSFGWHQDSGYLLGTPHSPYLTLWCALDDMTAENGALHVLPYERAGTRGIAPHRKEACTGDFIGFTGDDPGVVVPVARGGMVALSSTLFHRSGPNLTAAPRRAFLAAYSPHPITDARNQLWDQAVPFLRGGVVVHPA